MQLCDFDFLKNAKVEVFTNKNNIETVEKTRFLIHKYDFLQVGFQIDQAWYYCNNEDYILKSFGMNLGGHAVNLVGYDSSGVYVMNQWGREWGSKGFAIMPWSIYLKELMYGAYITGITY